MPSSALVQSSSAAPAPAKGKLGTIRVTVPRSFVSPALWDEYVRRPVGTLRNVMARSEYFGDFGWQT
eukprot:5009443-Prorocentrum_lima.AAC.1